ncbi:MAG: NAD kinase [Bacteroidales bacterium]|nr:NAD kinase [Bacteroidales bacterium]MBD5235819.1 NAD kinase [Barnesiella sp.]MBD5246728.1 NAD kinase [Barnesiella sp.]MBD5258180.1 NAD kinase [Barnesiella sp.]
MKVALYGSRHQDSHVDDIARLVVRLVEHGDSLVIHKKLYDYLVTNIGDNFARATAAAAVTVEQPADADVALSIGGDGTFLRTAQWVADSEIPIIGVNTGRLGFLAPFTVAQAAEAVIDKRLAGYKIQSRTLLRVDLPGGELDTWPYAINEVAVLKKDNASMITIAASIDRAPLADYLCDGLIVSTPTGSTGYNLSVGGPIVQPGSPSFILSPVAAHSLTMRPLVVDDSSLLTLRVTSRTPSFRISLDGRSVNLPCGTDIYLSRAPFVVNTICLPGHNFFDTIRRKLLWGASAIE